MTFKDFVDRTVSEKNPSNKKKLVEFWTNFYKKNFDSFTSVNKQSNSKRYKDAVIHGITNFPIPFRMLEKYLLHSIPTGLKKKGRTTWEGKINIIVQSYRLYTKMVCRNMDVGVTIEQLEKYVSIYESNLNEFRNRMFFGDFCLHY